MIPYVSIVTGTYNRLHSMKRMLDSVRSSVGVGIPYEVVFVDGGSNDGTLEFLRQQPDVVLIEQGELLGAVKAFNEGARKSRGKYVILANDDIVFRYESIQNAVAFMDDNPTVGIGCFPQNRYSLDYTVAKMPAVIDGKQTSTWYGQVCILEKALGDRVGWWGTEYHTYAGDNELSCNVLELGLKVVPLESCCIDDFVLKDELRSKNSFNREKGVVHPDSKKWSDKWTRNGLRGPKVSNFPLIATPPRKVPRMVYAPIYEDDRYPNQLKTKHGLRDALSKEWLVTEVNYRRRPDDLYYAVSMFMPDYVLIQYHDPKYVTYDLMMKMKDEFKNTKFISWNGDYNGQMLASKSYRQVAKLFDLATFVCLDISADYIRDGINYRYWQIGFEECDQIPVQSESVDVVFLGNCYSRTRQSMGEMLRFHKDWNTKLIGTWPSHIRADGNTMYDFSAGDAVYRSAKIAIGDNGFPDSYAYVSNRLFQALHSGVFLLQQEIPGMEEVLGLEDGHHLVTWKDLGDLERKIHEWLPKFSERSRIAIEGKRFVDQYHSFDRRVAELKFMLQELREANAVPSH